MSKNPRLKSVAYAVPVPSLPPGEARFQTIVILLTAVGLLVWLGLGAGRGVGWVRWLLIGLVPVIGVLSPVTRFIAAGAEPLGRPSPRARRRTALVIGIVSATYFILTAFNQGRDFFPKTNDDCSYLIGMQMLARGRLWMPALPLPDFFDSFYILVRPVYCSLYFPGTALLYVPTVWFHWPTYLMPAMASGAVVAMLYLIVTELLDGAAGLLAAIVLTSLSWFRVYSILLTSHVPMLLFGLLLVWSWLRWRESRRLRWALLMGVFAGWSAITRPADALVYALPVGVAIIWDLLKRRPRRWPAVPALLIAGAAPFLLLQTVFDRGVTGHALRTPYGYYLERDQPNTSFGFHKYDPTAQPLSTLPQKRASYDHWRPYLQAHTPANVPELWTHRWLPMIADTTTQCRLMLVFIPIALAGLADRRRWVLLATLPLFVLIYSLNPIFLEHYAILIMPAVIFGILLGGRTLAAAFPRWGRQIFAAFALAVLTISVTSYWEVNRYISTPQTAVSDETFKSPLLQILHDRLDEDVTQPAVVLFTHYPDDRFFEEPVYNTDVPWPDDAPVIRAHDLGDARNREIYAYYARTRPERMFYRFDPHATPSLKELGRARDLAAAGGTSQGK